MGPDREKPLKMPGFSISFPILQEIEYFASKKPTVFFFGQELGKNKLLDKFSW